MGLQRVLRPQNKGFPGGLNDKESIFNVGDLGSIPGLGKSPGGEHGNLLQYPTQRVSWIEEPGRLGSIATHRVRYD